MVGAAPAWGADSGTCPAPASYAGTGTSASPLTIGTPGQLQRLRDTPADWAKVVRLTADIGMGGCTWGSTIGGSTAFTGTFDGDGHVIRGLDITISGDSVYAGLIGYLGNRGVVQDLGFTGDVTAMDISPPVSPDDRRGYADAGGLIGFTYASATVQRSWASGDVVARASAVGDLTSWETVGAMAQAGGLIGESNGTVRDVFATGRVTAVTEAEDNGSSGSNADSYAGGLVGYVGAGSLARGYATGSPTGSAEATSGGSRSMGSYVGGIVGSVNTGPITTTGTFWDVAAWEGDGSGGSRSVGTSKSRAALTSFATFGPAGADWSIADGYSAQKTWGICPRVNGGLPFLTMFVRAAQCTAPNDDVTAAAAGGTEAGDATGNSAASAIVRVAGLRQTADGLRITLAARRTGMVGVEVRSSDLPSSLCSAWRQVRRAGKVVLACRYTSAARALIQSRALRASMAMTFMTTSGVVVDRLLSVRLVRQGGTTTGTVTG